MTLDNLTTLNELFNKRYSGIQQDLNKYVISSQEINGQISIPDVGLSGETELDTSVLWVRKPIESPELRVNIPVQEINNILVNTSLFGYIFDSIVDKSLLRYAKLNGAYDITRFGSHYALFSTLQFDTVTNKVYFVISGKYAKDK